MTHHREKSLADLNSAFDTFLNHKLKRGISPLHSGETHMAPTEPFPVILIIFFLIIFFAFAAALYKILRRMTR
jgi:hypothetical protein